MDQNPLGDNNVPPVPENTEPTVAPETPTIIPEDKIVMGDAVVSTEENITPVESTNTQTPNPFTTETVEPTPETLAVENLATEVPTEEAVDAVAAPVAELEPSATTTPATESEPVATPVEPTTVEPAQPEQPAVLSTTPVDQPAQPKAKKSNLTLILVLIFVLLGAAAAVLYFTVFNKPNDSISNAVETQEEPEVQNELPNALKIYSNSVSDFDLAFLKLENTEDNKVYSPLSIKYALAMLDEGAGGETKNQIESILGLYESKKYTNSENLSLANALYIRDESDTFISEDYRQNVADKYGAEVIIDDFSSPNNINEWVSGKTFGLVNNLISEIKDEDEFILVNALAIDMDWKNQIQNDDKMFYVNYYAFNEKYSKSIIELSEVGYSKLEFDESQNVASVQIAAVANKYDIVNVLGEDNIRQTVLDAYEDYCANNDLDNWCGSEKDDFDIDNYVEKLENAYGNIDSSTDFEFYETDDVKVFAKDLKQYDGTTLQYVGIMPTSEDLDIYVSQLKADEVSSIIDSLKPIELDSFEEGYVTEVVGFIPMFDYEYSLNLKEDLQNLGVTDVFDMDKSDLWGIMPQTNALIYDTVHKANITFSNYGIKAAAATALLGGRGSAGGGFTYYYEVPVKTIDITFDKPFLYLIRDKDSGEVWFTGTVYEPCEYQEYVNKYQSLGY